MIEAEEGIFLFWCLTSGASLNVFPTGKCSSLNNVMSFYTSVLLVIMYGLWIVHTARTQVHVFDSEAKYGHSCKYYYVAKRLKYVLINNAEPPVH